MRVCELWYYIPMLFHFVPVPVLFHVTEELNAVSMYAHSRETSLFFSTKGTSNSNRSGAQIQNYVHHPFAMNLCICMYPLRTCHSIVCMIQICMRRKTTILWCGKVDDRTLGSEMYFSVSFAFHTCTGTFSNVFQMECMRSRRGHMGQAIDRTILRSQSGAKEQNYTVLRQHPSIQASFCVSRVLLKVCNGHLGTIWAAANLPTCTWWWRQCANEYINTYI